MDNKEEKAITPEFQAACFRALWCCMTGVMLVKHELTGWVMLILICSYLIVKY